MTKIDIISGFLGAGKTTLIKKLINQAYAGEKLVLIENEFGEIGIDGGFLADAGIEITEMNSGCICCSLVGDFSTALSQVLDEYSPDRIIIEPSGVGKLSDVIKAVIDINRDDITLDTFVAVVDAKKCKMYMKNFGEFFNNQVEFAKSVVLSHTKGLSDEKVEQAIALIREKNDKATIISTDWDELSGEQIANAIVGKESLSASLQNLLHEHKHHHKHHHEHDEDCECGCHGHHHEHHHEHDEDCECGCHGHHHEHHHEHDEDCECGCHGHHHEHHHEHDEDCECGCHEHHHGHHHEHDEDCECGCHEHHHGHHHHHADEVFTSVGIETAKTFTKEQIESALQLFADKYPETVLRAKGIVKGEGEWIYFDYVPGEIDIRTGDSAVIGRICVIGSALNEDEIKQLF